VDLSRETHNVGQNMETNLAQSHRICSNNVSFVNLKRSETLIEGTMWGCSISGCSIHLRIQT
jgi:hypothetical protein